MRGLSDANHFATESKKVRSLGQLSTLLLDATREMGFDRYVLLHHVDLKSFNRDLDRLAPGEPICITNFPETYVERYVENHWIAVDPGIIAAKRTTVGFRWEDTGQMVQLTAEHRDYMATLPRAGIGPGYTIPSHAPGQPSGACNFAVRLGREMPTRNLPLAQLIGSFAFEAARSMVINTHGKTAVSAIRLTDRQIECVMLVGRGLTEAEIGRQLAISEETVKRHLKEARTACGASKSFQVVVRLLYDGDIALADLL